MRLDQYFLAQRELPPFLYRKAITLALQEDLGLAGDVTSDHLFGPEHKSTMLLRSRTEGVLAGLGPALFALHQLDPSAEGDLYVQDGKPFSANFTIARLKGATRALLAAERTLLNVLGHLCGVATLTNRLCHLIQGTEAQIVDTRKTLPGLRSLQKYAVRMGGAKNHRLGLSDCVMIKDNHRAAYGSLPLAVSHLRNRLGHTIKIEVEVDNLDQFQEALTLDIDIILLDNMPISQVSQAVHLNQKRKILEASGGITEHTILPLAKTGVQWLSIGALTHSAPYLDISLDIE